MHQQVHRGWITVDGFHILPEQSAAQYELFTSRKGPRLRMAAAILQRWQGKDLDPATRKLIESRLANVLSELGVDERST